MHASLHILYQYFEEAISIVLLSIQHAGLFHWRADIIVLWFPTDSESNLHILFSVPAHNIMIYRGAS